MKRQYQVLLAAALAIFCLALISRLLSNRSDRALLSTSSAKPSRPQVPAQPHGQTPNPKAPPAVSLTSFPPASPPVSTLRAQPDQSQPPTPSEFVPAAARPRSLRVRNAATPHPPASRQNVQQQPDTAEMPQPTLPQPPTQTEGAPGPSAGDQTTPINVARADTGAPVQPIGNPPVVSPAGAAMLKGVGNVLVNGNPSGNSAVFPGDQIDTGPTSFANISESGSSVVVQPNSSVRFSDGSVQLKHGAVAVTTDKGAAVQADGITISPLSNDRTTFDVDDSDERLYIAARTGAVAINDGSESTVLPEGQQTTRPKNRRPHAGAVVAGSSTSIRPALAVAAAGAAITAIVLTLPERESVSPFKP